MIYFFNPNLLTEFCDNYIIFNYLFKIKIISFDLTKAFGIVINETN